MARSPGRASLGTVVQWVDGAIGFVADVPESACLRAVAPLAGGRLVACGEGGTLAFLARGARPEVRRVAPVDLVAASAMPDDGTAMVVGNGAWALRVGWLTAEAEPVQTQKNLLSLAASPDGILFVGAEGSRVLRRSRTRQRFERVTPELNPRAGVVAVWSDSVRLRALCTDGAVLEGTRA